MTDEQRKEFDRLARLMMEWMCKNLHPHHTAIITPTSANLTEGVCGTGEVLDYLVD